VMWVMWNLSSFYLGHVQNRYMVHVDIPWAQKSFWTHSMEPLGDEAQWKDHFGLSDKVLILTQDRCTVCIERTIGSKIVLDAPYGTPRGRGSCGISLLSLWRQC
jgi:hypothetical protein